MQHNNWNGREVKSRGHRPHFHPQPIATPLLLFWRVLLFLAGAPAVFAAPPIISGISVTTDTNAAVVSYSVSPDSFCWVQYGVASGAYLWTSTTFTSSYTPGLCSVPITGLKDGTTYYFLPTARPDPDDETDICSASTCGAVEQAATMPNASVSHLPAPPVSVAANLLSEPDTTGYAIVNLVSGGAGVNNECVSSGNVSAPNGYSWSITAGETLTAILSANAMTFGTVFQVPQGTTCIVRPSYIPTGQGYTLPPLPVDPLATGGLMDAPNHRWIIFRTTPGGAADFPPFGTRTGPSFFSHYGGFKANMPDTEGGTLDGVIFEAPLSGVHHIWIENLMFSVDDTQLGADWGSFFQLGNGEGGGTPPFPEYMVIRGNYFHAPSRPNLYTGLPYMRGGILGTMGGQIAIVGNYMDNFYQYASGGFFFGIYFLDCGEAGACNTGGPVLIDNNYIHGMTMSLYVESNNSVNPSSAHDFTVTHNYLYWPYDTYPYAVSLIAYGCRNQIEFKEMQRASVTGNYINGQWACADTGPAFLMFGQNILTDITIDSNYITNSASLFAVSGEGTQNLATSHQSSGNRMVISNNLAYNLGRGQFNAGGGGIGTQVLAVGGPFSNLALSNNTFAGPLTDGEFYYPWVYDYEGGGNGPMAGFTFQNNIVPFGMLSAGLNTGGVFSQDSLGGGGVVSHPAAPGSLNSLTWLPVNYTTSLASFSGYTDGSPGLGMQGASVISGGTGYPNSGNLIFSNCSTAPVGTFSATAGVINAANFSSYGSGCNPATMAVAADTSGGGSGASLRPAYGLTPNYTWGGNVVTCTDFNGVDMTMADCTTLSATMPSGDVYASGNTTAARLAAAGIAPDYSITPTSANPGNVGANLAGIYSATGTVTGVSVQAGVTIAQISYTAPDSRACSVDTSLDGGITWTRATDTGGSSLTRTLQIGGLFPGAAYHYRVLCYAEQVSPLFSGGQITDGTFSTLPSISPSFAFSLSDVSGATSFRVTLTALDGAQYTNTCTTSPCVVPDVPVGEYSVVRQWLAGSMVVASSSSPHPVKVR